VRWPTLPQRHRHGYAAGIHRGLPAGDVIPAQEFPARDEGQVRTATQPISTGFELGVPLEGLYSAGSSRPPSRLASRARTIRRCRYVPSLSGLLATLPVVSRVRLPPASSRRCDGVTAKVSHLHSNSWRLVALYIGATREAYRTLRSRLGECRRAALTAALDRVRRRPGFADRPLPHPMPQAAELTLPARQPEQRHGTGYGQEDQLQAHKAKISARPDRPRPARPPLDAGPRSAGTALARAPGFMKSRAGHRPDRIASLSRTDGTGAGAVLCQGCAPCSGAPIAARATAPVRPCRQGERARRETVPGYSS
jgi:hypothetical protein